MSSFLTHLSQPNLDCIMVLRISGLPYLFSNAPPPLGWESSDVVTLDGEDYTWLSILNLGNGWSIDSTKIEPKGGTGQSSSLDFDLQSVGYQSEGKEDDPLLSLLLNTLDRRDERYIASLRDNINADLEGVAQDIPLIWNPWSVLMIGPTTLDLYLGTETVKVTTITALDPDVITGTITRGCYGSMAKDHIGKVVEGNKVAGGAMYVADYPLTMEGRYAELWCIPGDFRTDAFGRPQFQAKSQSISDAANQKIYAGIVDGTHEDGMTITIRTSSLDQVVKGSVMSQVPSVTVNASRNQLSGSSYYYIGPHNWWLHWDLAYNGYVASTLFIKITDNDDVTAGDDINFAGLGFTEGVAWTKGIDAAASYASIVTALNGSGTFAASYVAGTPASGDCVIIMAKFGSIDDVSMIFTQAVSGNMFSNRSVFNGGGGNVLEFLDVRLVRSSTNDGLAPYADVTEGVYNIRELSDIFCDTVNSRLGGGVRLYGNFTSQPEEDYLDPSKYKIHFNGYLTPHFVSIGADLTFITIHGQYQSFLRDIGFTDLEYTAEKITTDEDAGDNERASFRFKATKRPAVLRIPEGNFTPPARIYVDVADSFAIQYFDYDSSLWSDHNGDQIPMMCFIKDVGLFHFTDFPGAFVYKRYISGVTRASSEYGGFNKEEFYLEYDPGSEKTLDITRVLNFSGCYINNAFLFMLLSSSRELNNADYDAGWPGCGLSIPSRFVNITSFLADISINPQVRDRLLIMPGDSVREVFDEELKATQQQLVSDLGQLKLISMSPSLEVYRTSATTLDSSNIYTNPDKGIAIDRQANRIVNVVKLSSSYDYAEGKYYLEQINRKQDSIGTWGEKQELVIKVKGLSNTINGETVGKAIAQQIFSIYGVPYALFDVDIADKASWLYEVGDEVSISHPAIPHPTLPRRGAVDVPCKIVGKRSNILGDAKEFTTLSLMSWALFGSRFSCWAPSVLLTWGGSYWRISETVYGNTIGNIYNSDYFQDGYAVRCHTRGSASSITTSIISARTGSPGFVDITLSPNPTTSNPVIMCYDEYNSANLHANQRIVAYMSGYQGELYSYTGVDKPFKYL